jgi:cell division transport system ATP-binding protein
MRFLEFKKVYKVYPAGVKALDNVNLSLEKGEFVFSLGSYGCRKDDFDEALHPGGSAYLRGGYG